MTGRLDGCVTIVIGAGQGIGAAISERLSLEGTKLILADRNEAQVAAVAERLGAHVTPFKADLTQPADMDALAAHALKLHDRIDILVQNAGIYPPSLIEETSLEDWERVLRVNLTGSFLATKACLPAMRRQKKGRIVFTSSITGPRVSSPGMAAYAASKAGINGFIRTAALECAPDGITVNGVEPGNIMTEGLADGRSADFVAGMVASIPLGRIGQPMDVANAVLFLASDEAAFITGTTLIVDGGQIVPEARDALTAWR
jgi:3-oxoacyl-[acyl-carrier protein] reductase